MWKLILGGVLSCAFLWASGACSSTPEAQEPVGALGQSGAEASVSMDPEMAVGLWQTSFGPVKIDRNPSRGAAGLYGVWLYDREGRQVIGSFAGVARGNQLAFVWEEPTTAGLPLRGEGELYFDPQGQSFTGKWWTTNRDRGGEWNGWRDQGRKSSLESTP